MSVDPQENVVRAICTDKWDGERLSPSLFAGKDVSVSRLAIVPLEDHWDLFRRNIERPPERHLELIGEINVGRLQTIGLEYRNRTELTVEPDPVEWNPAHAVIPQSVSKGLGRQINENLTLHSPPIHNCGITANC
jgi:hypothetical protein